jgi:hypothetical protein
MHAGARASAQQALATSVSQCSGCAACAWRRRLTTRASPLSGVAPRLPCREILPACACQARGQQRRSGRRRRQLVYSSHRLRRGLRAIRIPGSPLPLLGCWQPPLLPIPSVNLSSTTSHPDRALCTATATWAASLTSKSSGQSTLIFSTTHPLHTNGVGARGCQLGAALGALPHLRPQNSHFMTFFPLRPSIFCRCPHPPIPSPQKKGKDTPLGVD